MKNNPVVIRISCEARKRLKTNAARGGFNSIIEYVEELSEVKLDKKTIHKSNKK